MKTFANPKFVPVAALLLLLTCLPAFARQADPQTDWAPPPPRKKAFTLFAPRPTAGNNIFKGEAEKWLARAVANTEALTPIADKSVSDYVSLVGRNLAAYSVKPDKPYEFIVLDDEEVNAINAGRGRIYVNLGMLKAVESEDELAGVLAHEIAHDAFGHAPKTVTRQLFWMKGIKRVKTYAEVEAALEALLEEYRQKPLAALGEVLLGFSRFDELEADRAAFYNAFKAGYNPRALSSVLRRMEREAKKELGKDYRKEQLLSILFGSHPPTGQRTLAFSWESNFVKMPPAGERYRNAAFDAMKEKAAKL